MPKRKKKILTANKCLASITNLLFDLISKFLSAIKNCKEPKDEIPGLSRQAKIKRTFYKFGHRHSVVLALVE